MTKREARRYALTLAADLLLRDIGTGNVCEDNGVSEKDQDKCISAMEDLAADLENKAIRAGGLFRPAGYSQG